MTFCLAGEFVFTINDAFRFVQIVASRQQQVQVTK